MNRQRFDGIRPLRLRVNSFWRQAVVADSLTLEPPVVIGLQDTACSLDPQRFANRTHLRNFGGLQVGDTTQRILAICSQALATGRSASLGIANAFKKFF